MDERNDQFQKMGIENWSQLTNHRPLNNELFHLFTFVENFCCPDIKEELVMTLKYFNFNPIDFFFNLTNDKAKFIPLRSKKN